MSRENVEIVERVLAAWSRADLDAVLAAYDPAVELDFSHFSGWMEQEVYRGRDQVRGFLQQWLATWESYEQGADRYLDAGDRVAALVWQRAKGHESGAATEMLYAQVVTLRDGKIVRIENYSDRAAALEAVGLSE